MKKGIVRTKDQVDTARAQAVVIMAQVVGVGSILDMCSWQSPVNKGMKLDTKLVKTSVDEIHSCGSSACLGGYIAISDQWLSNAGFTYGSTSGTPKVNLTALGLSENDIVTQYANVEHDPCKDAFILTGPDAIGYWLGLNDYDAYALTFCGDGAANLYDGTDAGDVTAQDVLDVLINLADTGGIWMN